MQSFQGLTDAQASRLLADGKGNSFGKHHSKPTARIIFENTLSGNNVIMLVVIIGLYIAFIALGDPRLLMDSIGIVMVFVVNSVAAIIQELRARSLLEKARLMLPQSAVVLRGGIEKSIPQEEIVVGDIVVLRRGDFAPVDGKIISAASLEMDESLLTGESLPISKSINDEIFSGSFCVSGSALYLAEKVGDDSLAASITDLARKYKFVTTPLQRNLNRIFLASFAIALIAVAFEIAIRREELFGDVDFIRRIAAVVLSLLPGGLIFFSTVTFAIGVWRVSLLGALTQKLNAIESFSTITTVCMDKTGTLTQNAISIFSVSPINEFTLDEAQTLAGTFARLCTNPNATIKAIEKLPFDESAVMLDELAFSSARKYSAARISTGDRERVFVLGAPESLQLDNNSEVNRIIYGDMCGYRNVAFGECSPDVELNTLADDIQNIAVRAIAVISLQDPLRNDVQEALELFREQDIRLKILSGDHPDSVFATINAAGWNIKRDEVVTGVELDSSDEVKFDKLVRERDVFARLSPEHKLRILQSLNRSGARTAMIGDGVNDVPAIKEAALGIAMEEGSGMTKEISDIILLKNKFSLLPSIFSEGNNIVSTVLLISEIYLVKNFIVLFLSLLRTAGVSGFYDISLTPRKTALLTTAGVALPAYCIALWNGRTEPQRRFFRELFGALAITLAGFAVALVMAEKLTINLFRNIISATHLPHQAGHNALLAEEVVPLAVIVYSLILNCVVITVPHNRANAKKIIVAGFAIAVVFSIFLWIPSDNIIARFVYFFYEFNALPVEIMPTLFGSVIVGALVSAALRKLFALFSTK
ncbi:HAD-IC family P-type ATPase [Ignavibacteria bacterium]|nr:HAD-IC family P-type ATPase [Bacteroidota bacterium]MCZ2132637.1 HAD-IC family P-type ATPase [Bacteroidota bacterium]